MTEQGPQAHDFSRGRDVNTDITWRAQAACRGLYPDLFYPPYPETRDQQTRAAQVVCATCPVKAQCLAYAVEHNEHDGIWGGTTHAERRRLRAQQRTNASERSAGQRCTA